MDTKEKAQSLAAQLRVRADQFERQAATHALAALQAERMAVNPADAQTERECALTDSGIATGLRDAVTALGLHFNL